MKNLFKRLVSGVVTLVVMSFSAMSAFAADVETNDIETAEEQECIMLTVTSEGITSVTDANGERSVTGSISGYGYSCLRSNSTGLWIYTEGEGKCNMGITIKTQSSWDGTMTFFLCDGKGKVFCRDRPISSNKETVIPATSIEVASPYIFNFSGIPEGVEVHTWIWIYG